MAKDFHERCDDNNKTISLFQIKDRNCIGGFSAAMWHSSSAEMNVYSEDSLSMLFNLNKNLHYPISDYHYAIKSLPEYGPYFGVLGELTTLEPFNEQQHCRSNMFNNWGYKVPEDKEKRNMLTSTARVIEDG